MITIGVTLRSLTLPDGLSESLLRRAVNTALDQYNRALDGIARFRLEHWPESEHRVFIEFHHAAKDVAEMEVGKGGKDFTLRLDPDQDWDLKRRWFMRFGAVSTETFLMHELAHIAQFAHEDDPDSILFAAPFPRRKLAGEDSALLRRIFRQWASQQGGKS